tara:strand:- start:184 stop:654 length:471 start_codon:yes stop_codon:yes gene_type:complete
MTYLRVETWKLWLFCFLKIPLIGWLRPRIIQLSATNAEVMIKLTRRSKNHVNSMYFGAICVGVDLVPGALAMHLIKHQQDKINFVFKDFHAEFLHRAEGDVHFTCDEGHIIAAAIEETKQKNERANATLNVTATVPSKFGTEPVGKFKLTISLKKY